jgi:hypothetical protein
MSLFQFHYKAKESQGKARPVTLMSGTELILIPIMMMMLLKRRLSWEE